MGEENKIEAPKEKPFFTNKSAAGKGDRPRNISRQYWDNYESINWHRNEKSSKTVIRIDKNTVGEF